MSEQFYRLPFTVAIRVLPADTLAGLMEKSHPAFLAAVLRSRHRMTGLKV